MNELDIAEQIAGGELPSPQQFGASFYWAIRISGTGCAWRESVQEFCWREPSVWLSPEMCARAASLPVLVDHPEKGVLNSPEFAARCVGVTTFAYVKDDELWAVARILDRGANAILLAGAYEDTSSGCDFRAGRHDENRDRRQGAPSRAGPDAHRPHCFVPQGRLDARW